MRRINIFFHVATINNYQQVFEEIFQEISQSGLFDKIDNLFLSVVGNGELNFKKNNKITHIKNSELNYGEFYTLQLIEDFCKTNTDCQILYLHTKGVSTPNNECIIDWRKYMTYFNVNQHEKCLKSLKTHNTCGVDLVTTPTTHYSGNFWWANSNYIKTLPKISEITSESYPRILSLRHNAEFWICMNKGSHDSLWNSNINVYERHLHIYKPNNYIKQ